MKKGLNYMPVNKVLFAFILLFSTSAFADMEYQKNTMLGGRAATLAGAYTAISDDASAAFYNPAGLSFATTNSFSGSSNVYSTSSTVYEKAIDNQDWKRNSNNLKPNFFGVVQKKGNETYAFSYAVTDAMVEHQDQIFQHLTTAVNPIDLYVLNLHQEDNTYLIGPSYAKKISDEFSWGASFFYHYRLYRRAQSQLIRYTDTTDEASYSNTTKKEKGFKPEIGFMKSKGKFSFGATLAKTLILTSLTDSQLNQKAKGASTYGFSQQITVPIRKTPFEIQSGLAYFASPYLLFSSNLDYYLYTDNSHVNVMNLSFGGEYYLSEKHAIRSGLFSNRTNTKETSKSTRTLEHIDMYGLSAGYTLYSGNTAITFGGIYSTGTGKAQIYDDSSATVNVKRNNFDFVVSADYGI